MKVAGEGQSEEKEKRETMNTEKKENNPREHLDRRVVFRQRRGASVTWLRYPVSIALVAGALLFSAPHCGTAKRVGLHAAAF